MKQLILFSKPILVPDDKEKTILSYGLVVDKDMWMKTRWNTLYVKYIITGSELYGDGYRTSDGEVFVKDDTVIKLDDRMWNEYEAKTKDNDVKYSIVEDNVEIADEDYFWNISQTKTSGQHSSVKKIWCGRNDGKSGCPN